MVAFYGRSSGYKLEDWLDFEFYLKNKWKTGMLTNQIPSYQLQTEILIKHLQRQAKYTPDSTLFRVESIT